METINRLQIDLVGRFVSRTLKASDCWDRLVSDGIVAVRPETKLFSLPDIVKLSLGVPQKIYIFTRHVFLFKT